MGVYIESNTIIFENRHVTLRASLKNGSVESVFAKSENKEIIGENTYLFSLISEDRTTEIIPLGLEFADSVIRVSTAVGDVLIRAEQEDDYFTFTLVSPLPERSYKLILAHIKYEYNYGNKANTGAAGIAMTYSVNPCFFPDSKDKETKGEVLSYLENDGAKYALIIAPIAEHKEIIKKVCNNIDPNKGITLKNGGALGDACKLNKGNWIMQFDTSAETVKKSIDFYKKLGIDIVDYHKWYQEGDKTFRQGDFKHSEYETAEAFKKNVIGPLEENGMCASLHTYAYLIDYECDTILSDPDKQKDLLKLREFTCKDLKDGCITVHEDISDVTDESGFILKTTPYLLVGEEIIKFKKSEEGFLVLKRGVAGTKEHSIKKGDKVYQLEGIFGGFVPKLGSKLFFEVARNTAKVYNEYGYKAIYVDALDAVLYHCDRNEDEMAYYMSAFVCEILKYCDRPPVFDCSIRRPCIWASRGRVGNFDTPYRGYKNWNRNHIAFAKSFKDMYLSPSLGWYNFYREPEKISSGNFDMNRNQNEPGNYDKKYQHFDSAEYIGSLALIHNCSMTYIEITPDEYEQCPARKRNIEIYKKYDNLRKSAYFSKETLESLMDGKYEYHAEKKPDGSYVLREKEFSVKTLFDLADARMRTAEFLNPFEKQTPFVRIEALVSQNAEDSAVTILKCDKAAEIAPLKKVFDPPLDLSQKLVRKVRVVGNGKKGGAVAIKLKGVNRGGSVYLLNVIDTDFEGEREFILAENVAGERHDLPFDQSEGIYSTFRFSLPQNEVKSIEIETAGDVSGVRLSDISAMEHRAEIITNPSLKIGNACVQFLCELKSCDFIEFDGKSAKMIDGFGNEKEIEYRGSVCAPKGEFKAELTAECVGENTLRAQLTFGFSGKEIR